MKQPLHSCSAKVVIADGDQLEAGLNWMLAHRAVLSLYDDHLKCADWQVGYGDIRRAEMVMFKTPILRMPAYVLSVRTDANVYHFGLRAEPYWDTSLPFPVTRSQAKLRLSAVSVLGRCALIGGVIYWAWIWFLSLDWAHQ